MSVTSIRSRPRLRRSDCSGPGLRRVRRGRGFAYQDGGAQRIQDPETIERIRALYEAEMDAPTDPGTTNAIS